MGRDLALETVRMVIGIHWDDTLRLGFAPLDEQHEQIFAIIADIDRRLEASAPLEAVVDEVRRLRDALAAHFEYEDRLMMEISDTYFEAKINKHRADHADLLGAVDQVISSRGETLHDRHLRDLGSRLLRYVILDDGELVSALVHAGMIRAS